ncbi:MAG TPA: hypothetical protein VKY31_01365 [Terriglobia bacterium]|nr:hypothetical protein [Terriglobia bacterium]
MRGRVFTEKELVRIQSLLAETDMSFKDIATRMGCAKSSIVAVNRRLRIRQYNGCRTRWDLAGASDCDYAESVTVIQ